MSACRRQALIEAPLSSVWRLVGDPSRYPEWAGDVVEVTGLAEIAENATFEQLTRGPLGQERSTFEIERLDDMHEIKLRCHTSGYYSHWTLTEAQNSTFAEVEIGIDPTALQYRLMFGVLGKRYLRRLAEQSLEGVRDAVRPPAATGHG
jgi:uncharacterized protein YndB with AHSA1/START domain